VEGKELAGELQLATNAFGIATTSPREPEIFDMCMAPDGFLATALVSTQAPDL
jgi:hypothetical protein